MNQQAINELVTEIVNNLIQQTQFVNTYRNDINGEIDAIRALIADLIKQKVPRTTIVNQVSHKYAEIHPPTIINITKTQTKTFDSSTPTTSTNSRRSVLTSSASHSYAKRKYNGKKLYNGKNGGLYYLGGNLDTKVYLTSDQKKMIK